MRCYPKFREIWLWKEINYSSICLVCIATFEVMICLLFIHWFTNSSSNTRNITWGMIQISWTFWWHYSFVLSLFISLYIIYIYINQIAKSFIFSRLTIPSGWIWFQWENIIAIHNNIIVCAIKLFFFFFLISFSKLIRRKKIPRNVFINLDDHSISQHSKESKGKLMLRTDFLFRFAQDKN